MPRGEEGASLETPWNHGDEKGSWNETHGLQSGVVVMRGMQWVERSLRCVVVAAAVGN